MTCFLQWMKYELEFIRPAKTSRGAYSVKTIHLIEIQCENWRGMGEIAPLPDLSIDGQADMEAALLQVQEQFLKGDAYEDIVQRLQHLPSLQFALECAWQQIRSESKILFDTPFTRGKKGIPINGLVWMSDVAEMETSATQKIQDGFRCIKFKVGAQDHDTECRMLERIRKKYSPFQLEIRLDANGAYATEDVQSVLKDFARFQIHSMEQPIRAGQWEAMQEVCAKSPLDIALDEELIGISVASDGLLLLKTIQPQYIILKPTLLGGFSNCDAWIALAEHLDIGWWATSALESNVGLSHIAQWVSTKNTTMPQGLGTGALYKNNFPASTHLKGETMWFGEPPIVLLK